MPRPSTSSASCAWRITLMKPGATARPCASMSVRPLPVTVPDCDDAIAIDRDIAAERIAARPS